jgi:hypothetical protein
MGDMPEDVKRPGEDQDDFNKRMIEKYGLELGMIIDKSAADNNRRPLVSPEQAQKLVDGKANGKVVDLSKFMAIKVGKPRTIDEFVTGGSLLGNGTYEDPFTEDSALRFMHQHERLSLVKSTSAGKPRFIQLGTDVYGQTEIRKYDVGHIELLYCDRWVSWGTGEKIVKKQLGKWWVTCMGRKVYGQLFFDPGLSQEHGGNLNLYEGMQVTPIKGSWRLMKRHIWRIICKKDKAKFRYIMRWLAWCIQNPDKPAEAAVVLRGKKGGGKGVLPTQFVEIFGNNKHGLAISNRDQLVGRFTGHLCKTVFLLADEAYFPGDKPAEGKLKQLITEPWVPSEAKFEDLKSSKNCLHVFMCSNELWVVPATEGERRYFVVDIDNYYYAASDEERAQIKADGGNVASTEERDAYFKALWAEMNGGGREAMLYDMQQMKLGDWHPRQVLKTAELQEQVRQGMPYLEQLEDAFGGYDNHKVPIEDVRLLLFGSGTNRGYGENRHVGTAMTKLGWRRTKCRYPGVEKPKWSYVVGAGDKALEVYESSADKGRFHVSENNVVPLVPPVPLGQKWEEQTNLLK